MHGQHFQKIVSKKIRHSPFCAINIHLLTQTAPVFYGAVIGILRGCVLSSSLMIWYSVRGADPGISSIVLLVLFFFRVMLPRECLCLVCNVFSIGM